MDIYRYRLTSPILVAAIVWLFALGGCGRVAGPVGIDAQFTSYESAVDPDGCVRNFAEAWQNTDIDAYANLVLYSGDETAADGKHYEPFTFYFIDFGRNPESYQGYEVEVANVGRMFSGNPGKGGRVPGIERISVTMHKNGDWRSPAGDQVLGHDYPPGTRRCVFDVAAFMELKGTMVGSDGEPQNGFGLDRRQEFFVIPVRLADGGETGLSEYRIWKWVELPN